MAQYGQIKLVGATETFVAEVTHDTLSPDMIKKLANGRAALRPIVPIADPAFDPDTQKLSPFTYQILADRVEKSRSIVALTPGELSALARQKLAATNERWLEAIEALMDVLVSKGALTFADLPPDAEAVFTERKNLRQQIQS